MCAHVFHLPFIYLFFSGGGGVPAKVNCTARCHRRVPGSSCPRVLGASPCPPHPRRLATRLFRLVSVSSTFFFFFFLVPPPSDSRNAGLRKRGSFHSAPCPLGSSALSWARPLFQGCVIFHSVRAARCPDLSVRAQTLRSSQYRGCRRRGVQKAPGAAVRCPLS